MEKFSNWRDKGTGISPFMPVELPKLPLKKFLVDPLTLLVKLPVFLFLYAVATVAPKPVFKVIFTLLFRFEDLALLVEGVRRTKTAEIDQHRPSTNQVIVSNWVSPLDVFVIYLISTVGSLGDIDVLVPLKTGVYKLTPWQTVLLFFGEDISVGAKVSDLAKSSGKLVILFAEGTATNNRAVLPVVQVPQTFTSLAQFSYAALVLKVYPNSLTLPIPHLTKWQYLSLLLTCPDRGFVKAKIVPLQKFTLASLRLVYADNGLSTVELGPGQKEKFWEYYQSYAVSNLKK